MQTGQNELSVQSAARDDAGDIARIFVESWRDTYAGLLPAPYLVRMSQERQRQLWLREISHRGPQSGVIVATDPAHGVIGFCSYGPARDDALGYEGEIYTLYVDPNHTGRGAGRALVRAAFARLFEQGLVSAVILALKGNPARYFYQAEGGQVVAERPGGVGGIPAREVAFGWPDIMPAVSAWTR